MENIYLFILKRDKPFFIIANTDTLNSNNSGYTGSYYYIDDDSLVLINCNTGLNNQNENVSLSIYPNSINDKLNIKKNSTEFSEIILYDITSRKLLQQRFSKFVSINTEQLAKGLYLYEVRSGNGLCKKGKILKE